MDPEKEIQKLIGLTITNIVGAVKGSTDVVFTTSDGRSFTMYHSQDCCEHVEVVDIVGDITDLFDSPIVRAEERSNTTDPIPEEDPWNDSHTWTFYELATNKGSVTLRWLGQSNGYYSEDVSFVETTPTSSGRFKAA